MFQVIVDLLLAGTETTSTTLHWGLLYLIRNPDVQRKCRQEILQVTANRSSLGEIGTRVMMMAYALETMNLLLYIIVLLFLFYSGQYLKQNCDTESS